MHRFIARRLGFSLLVVWGVVSLTFVILHLAPGDPATLYIKPEIDTATIENIRTQMGLDLPVWRQYFRWIAELTRGNLGVSFSHNRPVAEIFTDAIPNTLQLTATVFLIQLIAGIVLGVPAALKQNSTFDFSLSSILMFLYSMPGFWLALMAIWIFSHKLGLLPASQMVSFDLPEGLWPQVTDRFKHLILPSLVLSTPFIAHTARFVRGSLCEVLDQDYIRTARAYGLSSYTILFRYALKNALLPLTTVFGLYLPFLLGGSVVIEYIFAWPGMGRIIVNAILAHDFPVILAGNILAAVTVVVGNLASDLVSTWVDPRVRAGIG
ncbi:ABC transporter permease [bacterium]|nr:ABC transporter permease [bacterium]